MKNELFIADIHMTEKAMDSYRWQLFPYLVDKCIKPYQIDKVIFLGDLTERKDKHTASLVNGVTNGLNLLLKHVQEIVILKGNHDYIEEENPFFKFISGYPNITYINQPTVIGKDLFIPHTNNFDAVYKKYSMVFDYIYMHQPVKGATTSNAYTLNTVLDPGIFEGWCKQVYSGDIHVPQDVGLVRYVGAPYHVYFGDNFTPRIIVRTGKKEKNLYPEFPAKWHYTISEPTALHDKVFHPDDMAKITFRLDRSDFFKYDAYKKEVKDFCKNRQVVLAGVELVSTQQETTNKTINIESETPLTKKEIFTEFAKQNKLGSVYIDTAFKIMDEAKL